MAAHPSETQRLRNMISQFRVSELTVSTEHITVTLWLLSIIKLSKVFLSCMIAVMIGLLYIYFCLRLLLDTLSLVCRRW